MHQRADGTLAQIALFGLGLVVLVVMAIGAHSLAFFPGDVAISHAVQSYRSDWLDAAFAAVSWMGFPPQSQVFFGLIVVFVLVWSSRWAAVIEAIAAVGSGGLYLLLEPVVGQPRPSAELVRVMGPIQMTGFPSGHMATFAAVFGFVAYLGYRRFGPAPTRWLPVAGVAGLLVLMGLARIYAGHHWASDVLAGCLLGLLWLAVVIRLYAWGEGRFARRPPRQRSARPSTMAAAERRRDAEEHGPAARPRPTQDPGGGEVRARVPAGERPTAGFLPHDERAHHIDEWFGGGESTP